MTDMNAAYIIVLDKSTREDVDETLQLLKHLNGVISVKPVVEDIPQHIAEERILQLIEENVNESIHNFINLETKIQEKIERGKEHRDFNLKMFKEDKTSSIYANRFKNLLDKFIYCDEKELNEKQKELRLILKEFCGEHLCCIGGPYEIPDWGDSLE